MTTQIPPPKTAIESNAQALGALKVSLTNSHEKLDLDLISIVGGEITAAKTNQNTKNEDEIHQLEFRLGKQVWSEAATLKKADSPNLILSLVNRERPKPDSRVSRRWPNSRLHPLSLIHI